MTDLSSHQDSLQKQKIEGFTEYRNDLNALTAKQFMRFLPTSVNLSPSMQDYKNFVSDEVKPISAIQDLVHFFTKEGDRVLDLFAGEGNISQVLAENGCHVTLVEKDPSKYNKAVSAFELDAFLEPLESSKNTDALTCLSHYEGDDFDFIILDPPMKSKKSQSDSSNLSDLPLKQYIEILSTIIDNAAEHLKSGKYLVCLLQDFYKDGNYYSLPSLVSDNVCMLKLNGLKIYSRDLDRNPPNSKVYAPQINHFYALIFKKNDFYRPT